MLLSTAQRRSERRSEIRKSLRRRRRTAREALHCGGVRMRTWRAVAGVLQAQQRASDRIGRFALMIRLAPIDVLFGTAQPVNASAPIDRSAVQCSAVHAFAFACDACVRVRS